MVYSGLTSFLKLQCLYTNDMILVNVLDFMCNHSPTDEFATNIAVGNINVQTGERVRNFPLPSAEVSFF